MDIRFTPSVACAPSRCFAVRRQSLNVIGKLIRVTATPNKVIINRIRLAGFVMLLVSCGDRDAESGDVWTGVPESQTADVITMDSAVLRDPPVIAIHEDLRISTSESSELTEVTDIAIGDNGRLYILDGRTSRVWVFDSLGQVMQVWGNSGGGPGEFVYGRSIAAWADTVAVVARGQIVSYLSDGTPLEPKRLTGGSGFRTAIGTRNGLAIITRYVGERPIYQDTIVVEWAKSSNPSEWTRIAFADAVRYRVDKLYQPWALMGPRLQVSVAEDGVILVNRGAPYKLELYSSSGEVLERWESNVARVPTSDSDFSKLEDYLVAHAPPLADMDARVSIRKGFKVVPKAHFRPILGEMLPAEGKSVLVQRLDFTSLPYVDTVATPQWDLLVNGTPKGRINVPAGAKPVIMRGNSLYAVERDSLGLRTVVRYRIARS